MKIGSFQLDGQALYGIFEEAGVRVASAGLRARFPTLRDLIEADALDALQAQATDTAPLEAITFLPPVPNPHKIICVGLNYHKPYPVDGTPPPVPDNIILFGKEREALVGHGAPLEIPQGDAANSFDYEGEIAIVIGRAARHVSVADAMQHVLGYSVFNDGSVRDWQRHSIYAGKNFQRSGAWGPWITTADEVPDPAALRLSVQLNGETVQDAGADEMIYSIAQQISYASHLFTLHPGDVIATGSPDGVGGSRNPKRFLRSGDRLSLHVSQVGTLQNTVP